MSDETKKPRKTVGASSLELSLKEAPRHSAHDQSVEQLKDYEKNMVEAIETGKKEHGSLFFIVVITKRERLLPNVFRNYFVTRKTCPTPEWDQVVYMFDPKQERRMLLWALPAMEVCLDFVEFPHEVSKEERLLLEYVLAFDNGTLLTACNKLNEEAEKRYITS